MRQLDHRGSHDQDVETVDRALAAFARTELTAPVVAIDGFIDLLFEEAEKANLSSYMADLGRMRDAATRVSGLIEDLIAGGEEQLLAGLPRKLRHDLKTPLSSVLGYGDMLGEEAGLDGHENFVGLIDGLLQAARRLLAHIDASAGPLTLTKGEGPETGAAAARRSAAEAIRAVLVRPAETQPIVTGEIVVVDDDPSNRELLDRRLSRDGHTVSTMPSGETALAWMEDHPVDLVILDLIMPGLNGVEVLRRMRAREETRQTPVIIISGLDESDGAIRCIEAGADDYLSKPVDAVLLRARISAALERKRLRDREVAIARRLQAEQERAESLLRNMLPESVVARLRAGESTIADRFDCATILFCDIVGFTGLASRLAPDAILDVLNAIFSAFDSLAAEAGVEKIKTIGDAYMVAGGLPEWRDDHAAAVAAMAIRLPEAVREVSARIGCDLTVRIGIDTGPVAAGIIGHHKFSYDVWGDTVNTASRMEHHGVPGRVHITEATRLALGDRYDYEPLSPLEVKGKGIMNTFLIR